MIAALARNAGRNGFPRGCCASRELSRVGNRLHGRCFAWSASKDQMTSGSEYLALSSTTYVIFLNRITPNRSPQECLLDALLTLLVWFHLQIQSDFIYNNTFDAWSRPSILMFFFRIKGSNKYCDFLILGNGRTITGT